MGGAVVGVWEGSDEAGGWTVGEGRPPAPGALGTPSTGGTARPPGAADTPAEGDAVAEGLRPELVGDGDTPPRLRPFLGSPPP